MALNRIYKHFWKKDTEYPILAEYRTDQLHQGKNLHCVTRVAERVIDNQRLLLALYVITTSVTRKAVADLFEFGLTTFRSDIAYVKALLSEECRKSRRQ